MPRPGEPLDFEPFSDQHARNRAALASIGIEAAPPPESVLPGIPAPSLPPEIADGGLPAHLTNPAPSGTGTMTPEMAAQLGLVDPATLEASQEAEPEEGSFEAMMQLAERTKLKCPKCDAVQSASNKTCKDCGHNLDAARKAKFANMAVDDHTRAAAIYAIEGMNLGVEGEDGLVWKVACKTGTLALSPGPGQRDLERPLELTDELFNDMVLSAAEQAFPYITVPETHANGALENTGYVRAWEVLDRDELLADSRLPEKYASIIEADPEDTRYLLAGIEFTEPEVKGKALRGSIPDTSIGVKFNYRNKRTGKLFKAAWEHLALTPMPWVDGLVPFGLSQQGKPFDLEQLGEDFEGVYVPMDLAMRISQHGDDFDLAQAQAAIEALTPGDEWSWDYGVRVQALEFADSDDTDGPESGPEESGSESPSAWLLQGDYPDNNEPVLYQDIASLMPAVNACVQRCIERRDRMREQDSGAIAAYSQGGEGDRLDAAVLKSETRNKLPDSAFAVPGERKFPIHDEAHARNALARASGTKYEDQVKAAVKKKYPDMSLDASVSGEGEGLDLAIHFDPGKHPRDFMGRWKTVVDDLEKGETATLPGGVSVYRGDYGFHVKTPEGMPKDWNEYDNPDKAAEAAVEADPKTPHPDEITDYLKDPSGLTPEGQRLVSDHLAKDKDFKPGDIVRVSGRGLARYVGPAGSRKPDHHLVESMVVGYHNKPEKRVSSHTTHELHKYHGPTEGAGSLRGLDGPGPTLPVARGLKPGEGAPAGQWTQHSSGDMEIEMPNNGATAQITQDEHGGPGKWSAYVFPSGTADNHTASRMDFENSDEAKKWADAQIVNGVPAYGPQDEADAEARAQARDVLDSYLDDAPEFNGEIELPGDWSVMTEAGGQAMTLLNPHAEPVFGSNDRDDIAEAYVDAKKEWEQQQNLGQDGAVPSDTDLLAAVSAAELPTTLHPNRDQETQEMPAKTVEELLAQQQAELEAGQRRIADLESQLSLSQGQISSQGETLHLAAVKERVEGYQKAGIPPVLCLAAKKILEQDKSRILDPEAEDGLALSVQVPKIGDDGTPSGEYEDRTLQTPSDIVEFLMASVPVGDGEATNIAHTLENLDVLHASAHEETDPEDTARQAVEANERKRHPERFADNGKGDRLATAA